MFSIQKGWQAPNNRNMEEEKPAAWTHKFIDVPCMHALHAAIGATKPIAELSSTLSFFPWFLVLVFIKENLKITKDFLSLPNPQNPWKRQRKHQNNHSLQIYQGNPKNQGKEGLGMAPKEWSNAVTINVKQLQMLINEQVTLIERQAWVSMNPEQFAQHFAVLLRNLARYTIRLSKPDIRLVLSRAKLSLTQAECSLWEEKLMRCISYVKTRLRDAGSGVHLPPIIKQLEKLWSKYHQKRGKPKKEKYVEKGQLEPNKEYVEEGQLEPKNEKYVEKGQLEAKPMDRLSSRSCLESHRAMDRLSSRSSLESQRASVEEPCNMQDNPIHTP